MTFVLESEARDFACPFRMGTRAEQIKPGVIKHVPACIGERCMGWRYHSDRDGTGYCGMAGHVWHPSEARAAFNDAIEVKAP